jgi:hypothetical protein
MAFVQIIQFQTDRLEEGRQHVDAYLEATKGRRTVQRSVLCRDRDRPDHCVNIVFFESYEAAMKNSELSETAELSEKLGELSTGEQTFLNLDVEWDDEG